MIRLSHEYIKMLQWLPKLGSFDKFVSSQIIAIHNDDSRLSRILRRVGGEDSLGPVKSIKIDNCLMQCNVTAA